MLRQEKHRADGGNAGVHKKALGSSEATFLFWHSAGRLKLIVGKTGIDGKLDLFLTIGIGKEDTSFLKRKSMQGFIEVEMVECRQAREGEIAFIEALFDALFIFQAQKKFLKREQRIRF